QCCRVRMGRSTSPRCPVPIRTAARSRFCRYRCGDHRHLHSFPTRRSSDPTETTVGVLTFPAAGGIDPRTATLPIGHPLPNAAVRSEEHTSELQSRRDLVCRLLLEKKTS